MAPKYDPPPEDFYDRGAVEAWLLTVPREWSVVIASRAALRVMPVLGGFRQDADLSQETLESDIFLPVLGCTALPWFAGNWSNQGNEFAARAAFAGLQARCGLKGTGLDRIAALFGPEEDVSASAFVVAVRGAARIHGPDDLAALDAARALFDAFHAGSEPMGEAA